MVLSQLLSPRDLLALNQGQLDSLDTLIEAEIIKSAQCMKVLKQKLAPAIREVQRKKKRKAVGAA